MAISTITTDSISGLGYGFKNRLINGNMVIDQRNAGASVTPTASAYTVDRWQATMSVASKFSVQQNAGSVTPPVGFTKYLGCTSTSAYTVGALESFGLLQKIEGFNVADFGWGTANAATVTLSFWVRSSLTGTFGGSIRNSSVSRSYPFSYVISAANTWEQKSVTIVGDTTGTWLTDNGSGMLVKFSIGAGSSQGGTAGVWASTNYDSCTGATSVVGTSGATFYITGVQLEKGVVSTSFDYRPYGTELALCQRYYEICTGRYGGPASNGSAASGTGWFKVTKRASPTMTWISTTSLLNFPTGAPSGYSPVVNDSYFTPFKIANGTNYDSRFDDVYSASAEL